MDEEQECPKTVPCTHKGNCSRRGITQWTILKGIILEKFNTNILDVFKFNFINYRKVFNFNGLNEFDLFKFKKHWPKSKTIPLLTPANVFVLTDEDIERDFFCHVPDGLYQVLHHDVIFDFDGISVPRVIPLAKADFIREKYYNDILHSFHPLAFSGYERKNIQRPEIAFDKNNKLARFAGFSFCPQNDN